MAGAGKGKTGPLDFVRKDEIVNNWSVYRRTEMPVEDSVRLIYSRFER